MVLCVLRWLKKQAYLWFADLAARATFICLHVNVVALCCMVSTSTRTQQRIGGTTRLESYLILATMEISDYCAIPSWCDFQFYIGILTTNLATCVCVQNVTHFSRKFCSHSKIPIRCLWTAFCVPLSHIFYEKQYFEWSMYAECNSGPLK